MDAQQLAIGEGVVGERVRKEWQWSSGGMRTDDKGSEW